MDCVGSLMKTAAVCGLIDVEHSRLHVVLLHQPWSILKPPKLYRMRMSVRMFEIGHVLAMFCFKDDGCEDSR